MFLAILRNLDPISNFFNFNGHYWLSEINIFSIIVRLLVAIVIGGVIGADREAKRKSAGFRTHILVCVASAVAMMTNQFIYESFEGSDVARLGAQVISGIGFLGAGTILLTSRTQVKGLTTAAGLWASACLGLCIGIGFYTMSIIGCLSIVAALEFLPRIAKKSREHKRLIEFGVEFTDEESCKKFVYHLREIGMIIYSLEKNPDYEAAKMYVYTVLLLYKKEANTNHLEIMKEIRNLDYVVYALEHEKMI